MDDLDGVRPEHGKLFILLETSDGCGFLAIGNALDRLEQEEAGLGRSFYIVLSKTMNQWMYIFDIARTEYFLDQWKESIEMDIEDGDGSEASFELYCKENDVSFPDLVAATPPCIRDINFFIEKGGGSGVISTFSKDIGRESTQIGLSQSWRLPR